MKFDGTWKQPKKEKFKEACRKAIETDLKYFKTDADYCQFISVNARPYQYTRIHGHYIKDNYPEMLTPNVLDICKASDAIGAPSLYDVFGRQISAGSMLYLKVMTDMEKRFYLQKCKNIVEIGPGYGGLANIIVNYVRVIKNSKLLEKYRLIDITESLDVAKLFLHKTNHNYEKFVFEDTDNITIGQDIDLVISNHCISELDKNGIMFYIKHVIQHAEHAYFLTSFRDIMMMYYFIGQMAKHFKRIEILPEEPTFNQIKDNRIIICSKK